MHFFYQNYKLIFSPFFLKKSWLLYKLKKLLELVFLWITEIFSCEIFFWKLLHELSNFWRLWKDFNSHFTHKLGLSQNLLGSVHVCQKLSCLCHQAAASLVVVTYSAFAGKLRPREPKRSIWFLSVKMFPLSLGQSMCFLAQQTSFVQVWAAASFW